MSWDITTLGMALKEKAFSSQFIDRQGESIENALLTLSLKNQFV